MQRLTSAASVHPALWQLVAMPKCLSSCSSQHGVYVAKYRHLLDGCIADGVPLLRMGPTCDELKTGLGGVPLPLLVVGSSVWAHIKGRCSVVSFGVMTSIALFLYMTLSQVRERCGGGVPRAHLCRGRKKTTK